MAESAPAAEYHHGEMDIHEQEATFAMFGALTRWGSLAVAVLLTLLVLLFCAKAGIVASVLAAAIVFAAGFLLLRKAPAATAD